MITEKSSRILDDTDVEIFGQDDWIMLTDGGAADFQVGTKYWGAMGVDGIDDDLGIALSGGDEVWVKVNVYIDLHEGFDTAILSQEIIDKCVLELADVAPAVWVIRSSIMVPSRSSAPKLRATWASFSPIITQ